MHDDRPRIWILDYGRCPLSDSARLFDGWTVARYFSPDAAPDWDNPPDAIFFAAEIPGGAAGPAFAELVREAGDIPLLAVSRLRSYAQALAFFRAGATDYLSLPLDEDDVGERLAAALERAADLALRGAVMEIEPLDEDPGEVSLSIRSAGLASGAVDEEPVAVEGLPIPTLWEELPCGLLVFDSGGDAVFSNSLGLEQFGYSSLGELREILENSLSSFSAYGVNQKPLADNQWPHIQARKTRTARSAVVSLEKPDRRRVWLRIDCLPHLADGKISRLTMTMVNLTGELPPLSVTVASPVVKKDKGRGKGRRKK